MAHWSSLEEASEMMRYEILLEAMEETPYDYRRAMDKSCWEVVMQTNHDWRELISDVQLIGQFETVKSAEKVYNRLRAEWILKQLDISNQKLADHVLYMFSEADKEGLYVGFGLSTKLPNTRRDQEGPGVRELRRLARMVKSGQ